MEPTISRLHFHRHFRVLINLGKRPALVRLSHRLQCHPHPLKDGEHRHPDIPKPHQHGDFLGLSEAFCAKSRHSAGLYGEPSQTQPARRLSRGWEAAFPLRISARICLSPLFQQITICNCNSDNMAPTIPRNPDRFRTDTGSSQVSDRLQLLRGSINTTIVMPGEATDRFRCKHIRIHNMRPKVGR